MALHLTIGNKNYSSWSLRPWIALKVAGIPFEETVIPIHYAGQQGEVPGALAGPARCRSCRMAP